MITDTARGDILHGAPDPIDSCLVLLPFTNNRTNSCLLLTKLLADGFVAHSSLVQVYKLISDVLGQLFGLAHGGEIEGVLLILWTGFFYTRHKLRSGVPC